VRQTKLPQGELKRVSVSLLLDQDVRWEGRAPHLQQVLVPPSAEKLKAIHDLVAGAIGFKAERGDQLILETLPFEATLRSEPPPASAPAPATLPAAPAGRMPAWLRTPKVLGGMAGGAILLLALAVLAIRKLRRRPAASATAKSALPPGSAGAPALGEVDSSEMRMQAVIGDHADAQARLEAEALQAIKAPTPSTNKKDVLSKYLRESLKKDSNVQIQILRTWLNEKV
jgi:flagellar M-ring protein FliF